MLIFTKIGALSDSETKLCQTCGVGPIVLLGIFLG